MAAVAWLTCTVLLCALVCPLLAWPTAIQRKPQIKYRSCLPKSVFEINKVSIDQESDGSFSFGITVTSTEVVKSGRMSIDIALRGTGGILKKSFKFDLCKVIPTGCPIMKGPAHFSTTQRIPSFIPKGTYDVNIKATDGTGRMLGCIKAVIKI